MCVCVTNGERVSVGDLLLLPPPTCSSRRFRASVCMCVRLGRCGRVSVYFCVCVCVRARVFVCKCVCNHEREPRPRGQVIVRLDFVDCLLVFFSSHEPHTTRLFFFFLDRTRRVPLLSLSGSFSSRGWAGGGWVISFRRVDYEEKETDEARATNGSGPPTMLIERLTNHHPMRARTHTHPHTHTSIDTLTHTHTGKDVSVNCTCPSSSLAPRNLFPSVFCSQILRKVKKVKRWRKEKKNRRRRVDERHANTQIVVGIFFVCIRKSGATFFPPNPPYPPTHPPPPSPPSFSFVY